MAAAMVMGLTACGSSADTQETTAAQGAETGESAAEGEAEAEASGQSGLEDGVLSVAMECSYAPYNWTQQDDSNGAVQIKGSSDYAYGYDVMMAKHIAEELGFPSVRAFRLLFRRLTGHAPEDCRRLA